MMWRAKRWPRRVSMSGTKYHPIRCGSSAIRRSTCVVRGPSVRAPRPWPPAGTAANDWQRAAPDLLLDYVSNQSDAFLQPIGGMSPV